MFTLQLSPYHEYAFCNRTLCADKCQWYDEHEINQIPCENIIDTKTSVWINQNRDEMHTEDYHRISSHPREVFSNSTFSNFVRETDCQDCCGKSPDYVKRVTPVSVASHGEKTRENASQPNTPLLPKLHTWVYMSSTYCQPCKTPTLRSLSITKISYLLSWRNKQKLLRTILSQLSENHISLKKRFKDSTITFYLTLL